ncbi:MAG TPA: HAMP domain-containing protein [Chloroflexi bacterium]|nr:HAMP domain-containing protein [Chloroflexota bacterium]
MSRWLRSLHAQLFLWAVLPVTFVIIALAFTGVYAHQQAMRDFVAERDLALARLTARIVEDGLAHGLVGIDGNGLNTWMSQMVGDQAGIVMVVDGEGVVLIHPDRLQVGVDLQADPGVMMARASHEGAVVVTGDDGELMMVAYAPIAGTDWVVLVWEPVEDLVGPILRFSSLAPIVAVGAGIVSLLVLTFGWLTIVRPLQRLAQATEQVSWGDYSAIRRPTGGVQEVQDLHLALTEMVERIQGYEAGMQDYLSAATQGQEAERARLAQELHDGPVQDLIVLGQQAEMARRLVEQDETGRARALLEEIRRAELETVDGLRRIIGALRPVYLEDLGFLPALEMLARQTAERTSAQVELEKEGALRRFAPEVELAAYRIAQEALHNAVQHAQAEHIAVRVGCDAEGLTLSIVDDGVSFELPPRPDLLTRSGHFGLLGMRERATRLGGTLRVDTAPGAGTRITARLPDRAPAT